LSTNRTAAAGAWLRLLLCVVARAYLTVLVGLALWALVPDVLGWHTVVVMTGSMEPKVQTGDALVYQPTAASGLRPGQVIIVHDPTHPGRLLSHRMTERLGNNELITRGDANSSADSTPVKPEAVLGLARLRVQYIGLPWKWLHEGRPDLAFGALALTLAAMVAAGADPDGPARRHRKSRLRSGALRTARRLPPGTIATVRRLAFGLAPALALVVSFSPVFSGFTKTTVNSANSFAAAAVFCATPSTTNLNANADTYVDQNNPTNNNGGDGSLFVVSQSGQNQRTLMSFPALPTVPAGCRVTSATLALKNDSGTNGRTLQALRATASWTEGGATWNNQPTTAAGTATASSTSTSNATVSFTVTSEVQAIYASSAFGFVVRDQTESQSAQQKFFSRTGGTAPKLTVVIG